MIHTELCTLILWSECGARKRDTKEEEKVEGQMTGWEMGETQSMLGNGAEINLVQHFQLFKSLGIAIRNVCVLFVSDSGTII